jgi:thiosulfate/3-mercaptopyruvate sulfurtransferase
MNFLVEAAALKDEIRSGKPLIIDVRMPAGYAKGHIRGAVNFSTYDFFATDTRPAGLVALAQEMAARYAAAGVSIDRPVVVYEEDTGMRAARDAWVLQYLGHPRVRMLHGGLAAWRAAGGELTVEPADDWTVVLRTQEHHELVMGIEEIAARLGRRDMTLLDVRNADEHGGRDKTACCARRGHIPGSAWIEWTAFLENGRFKSSQAIRELLGQRGVNPDTEIVPYCHRGARSANTFYALQLAGLPKVRNYVGSWHEWSARSELPIEKP